MYIILAILIFGVLIAVHELGHFLAAKLSGVRVLEFALGMGPVLLKKQGRETLYSLRLLPFGGFCAMEGEDEASDDAHAFNNQSVWKRLIILVAGAASNFFIGFLIVLALFSTQESFMKPVITGFAEGCPYVGEAHFLEGDEFYRINGHRIYTPSDASAYLHASDGSVDIVLIRDGEKLRMEDYPLELVPFDDGQGGTTMRYGFTIGEAESGFLATVKHSWFCTMDFVRMVWESLFALVSGAVGVQELAGPVGIVDLMNDVGQSAESVGTALYDIFYLFAFIAVNLAVMNLLPIPALDGGRIFFLAVTWVIEKITRRKLDPKYEGYINTAGFVLLMGLMVFVLFNDILRIFR